MAADPVTKNTVDSLLNYGVDDDDDPFKDIDASLAIRSTRDDKAGLSPRKRSAADADILGLDEEVEIKKKRKPVAKLDEERLLSAPGLPKLRALTRSGIAKKLRLKGKGHEFGDAAKLLNYFQLWLDDLYPRAKFADGLQMVEKVGHSKRMTVVRKEWIDEGKPGYVARKKRSVDEEEEEEAAADVIAMAAGALPKEKEAGDESFGDEGDLFFPEASKGGAAEQNAQPDEDELDALLAEQSARPASKPRQTEPESEGEDDLDALLAEQGSRESVQTGKSHDENEEEDDLDALLAEREAPKTKEPELPPAQPQHAEEDEDEGDELEAALAELGSREQTDATPERSSSPFIAIEDGSARERGEAGKSSSPIPSFEEEEQAGE